MQPQRNLQASLIYSTLSQLFCAIVFIASIWSQYAYAKNKVYYLTIKDHIFTPSTLAIPANVKVKIIIENKDNVAEEFDSFDLNREKVIFAGKKSTIYVGPLPAGTYEYFGEFHPNTARGKIIVVEETP
ncbi:cupredoxin domain-containing protein [Pseudocolwellia agarivorans]|uniref:cupredoxin domain-containing protein n=1 Tax=Pseudocolwellia agarivorans TaxID=1911682 RepID=UPI0009871646|nr:cupredoxin domain-containing protein [Pseudocolwellia agarivorans]